MEPITALVILACTFNLFASGVSCFTCVRTERYMASTNRESSTVEIDTSSTDIEESNGTISHTKTQHITITEADVSTLTGRSSSTENGRPNDVASTLAIAASGGLKVFAASTHSLPSQLNNHISHNKALSLPTSDDIKQPYKQQVIHTIEASDNSSIAAQTSASHAKPRRHSDPKLVASVILDALKNDNQVDGTELREIALKLSGESNNSLECTNITDI